MTTTQVHTVLPLREATDPRQAGVKAATLAALAAQGLPVPDGVVIPTRVFARALAAAREPPTARLEVPDDVLAALAEAVKPWGDVALAVRASAVDEDLADSSYAGLYTSVLHVRGAEALREAVSRCWTSAFADRVTAYSRGWTALPSRRWRCSFSRWCRRPLPGWRSPRTRSPASATSW